MPWQSADRKYKSILKVAIPENELPANNPVRECFYYMAKTIAAAIVDQLVRAGVKRVHGVVGDAPNVLTEQLRQSRSTEWIHSRHEDAAAFAAGAEAQLTGKLAVCAGSCGPGNMHLIHGLYVTHRST